MGLYGNKQMSSQQRRLGMVRLAIYLNEMAETY
jgi:hypothetical protein